MSNTKATHDGHCQVCGSLQRLPGGTLAKHGYTTRWGFFSGTCTGSGALPFEQDKSLIEAAIEAAKTQRELFKGYAADLRNREHAVNAGSTAWVHVYIAGSHYIPAGYQWRQREILTLDGRNYTYAVEPGDAAAARGRTTERLDFYYPAVPTTIAEAVFLLNAKRAEAYDGSIKQVTQYITWQRDRIANWSVQPLPVRKADVQPLSAPLTAEQHTALVALRGNGLPVMKLEKGALGVADWRAMLVQLRTEKLVRWQRAYLVLTPKGRAALAAEKDSK